MANFRRVQYLREEYQEGEPYEGSLLTFLFDIPYFPPCGVFPPFHLLNQFLVTGGSQGGMGPGTTWDPFSVTETEFAELVEAIRSTPLAEIKPHARYVWLKPTFDPSFDHIELYLVWAAAVCRKHRDDWKAALKQAGA